MTTKSYSRSARTLAAAAAVVGLLAVALAAQPVPEKFLQCNSDINLTLTPLTAAPGATVQVMMQLVNGPSNDALNAPLPQDWSQITFFPDCASIGATMPPTCNPTSPVRLAFAGMATSNCVDTMMANTTGNPMAQMDGSVVFSFAPNKLRLPAAATANGTTTCTITFNTTLSPTAMGGASIDTLAVSTVNDCSVPLGLNSQADGSTTLTVMMMMPTVGTVALVILALSLLVGAFWLLRRRPVGGAIA